MEKDIDYIPGAKIPVVKGRTYKIKCNKCKKFFNRDNDNRYMCDACRKQIVK